MQEASHAYIGRFEVVGKLGSGLHGSVYLARDPQLERAVAIKLLRGNQVAMGAPGDVLAEARTLAKLRHPNIVSVFEAGLHGKAPYYVMEYVQGRSLRAVLSERGALPAQEAVSMMSQVLAGLAHAHDQGIAHLDLAPGNILIDESGVPRVMDFGLSRQARLDAGASVTAPLVGTPRYMSPEHFRFEPLGPASDVYALGLILFETLTGRAVSPENDLRRIAERVLDEEPAWQRLREHKVDGALESVIRGALARERAARYPDARAMLAALSLWTGVPGAAPSQGTAAEAHGTVSFLLRRIQRKQDFPALSRNLVEINKLTAHGSRASARQLAQVVLRDYAVSNKLLKLANSAYYASVRGGVTRISDAITLLGFPQVRATCNGLLFFNHMKDRGAGSELLDALIASFLTGLVARHLGQRARLRDVEDAFLCGMFRGLGRSLTIYYFPDEYADILRLQGEGRPRDEAVRTVLGIGYEELGAAVAREWRFPDAILECMRPLPCGQLPRPTGRTALLSAASGLAHELCTLAIVPPGERAEDALAVLATRFDACFPMSTKQVRDLLGAAVEKFHEFAPILGVEASASAFLANAAAWAEPPAPPEVEEFPTAELSAVRAQATPPAPSTPPNAQQVRAQPGRLARLLSRVGLARAV